MKSVKILLFLVLVFLFILPARSHAYGDVPMSQNLKTDWGLEQNMGQLKDPQGNVLKDIQYFGTKSGAGIYCSSNSLSFIFIKRHYGETDGKTIRDLPLKSAPRPVISTEVSRIDMIFSGANAATKIIADNETELVKNYIKGNDNISGVKSYKKLTWVNIYPEIDLVLLVKERGLEYKFIIHPGGDPGKIAIQKKGMDQMEMLKDGGIKYATAAGTLTEGRPASFTGKKMVSSNFIKKGNSVSFKLGNFDHKKDLVIDPDLTWASYYGGSDEDEANSVTTDANGNVYFCGTTFSDNGIATSGAYQTTGSGAIGYYDAFIVKMNSNGSPQWATYFGGDYNDIGWWIAADKKGNVYLTGNTTSFSNIATSGAYQTDLGGSSGANDAFLAKFSASGALIWSTYFGGNLNEYAYSVGVDAGNNPVIGGTTAGSSGLATTGAFQTAFQGGKYDGFVAKFSSSGALLWSTFAGGPGDDFGYGVSADAHGNIYFAGYTTSGSGLASSGSYKSIGDSLAQDAFLVKFDSMGKRIWGTFFGGQAQEIAYNLTALPSGDAVIVGATTSTSDVATSGAYQTSLSGTYNAFVAWFNNDGTIKWSTYYGGDVTDAAYGVTYDQNGNIYLAGATASTVGIATSGAYQTAFSQIIDAFLAKFSGSGTLKYGTYYGSTGQEVAQSISVDPSDNIYIAGYTTSTTGMTTTGAYSTTYGGGTLDAFIARFFICNLTTSVTGKDSVCTGTNASYKAASHSNSAYIWTVTGGTILSGSGTDSIAVQWTGKNSGTVKAKEVNSITGCRDSLSITVVIIPLPSPGIFGHEYACEGDVFTYLSQGNPGSAFDWTVTKGNIKGNVKPDSITVQWPSAGTGKVILKETSPGGCINIDTATITINPIPDTRWTLVPNGSGNFTFKCQDSSVSDTSLHWTFGDASSGTGYHISHIYTHNGDYKVKLSETNAGGCSSMMDSTISILDAGIAELSNNEFNLTVFPNPFANSTEISYNIPFSANVKISLYDVIGKTKNVIFEGKMASGNHTYSLDASRESLAPGTYIMKIQIDEEIVTRRMIYER